MGSLAKVSWGTVTSRRKVTSGAVSTHNASPLIFQMAPANYLIKTVNGQENKIISQFEKTKIIMNET